MHQLALLPSVSTISAGGGINKPIIRGLSFNQIQVFGYGIRMDNQSWDDRHDIGIAGSPFTHIEIISGPAAILYGPNILGGAIVFRELPPGTDESFHGYVQSGLFSNSRGLNLDAGIRQGKSGKYFALSANLQGHTNYTQGGGKKDKEPAMAFNSKYTNISLKGMAGIRNEKRSHQINYSLYQQFLGIVEDENLEALNNPGKKAERDYEMEAPYQFVQTHVISSESKFKTGKSQLLLNAGYQFNRRKEFEPGDTGPKSKFLAVALDLQTFTTDLQWQSDRSRAFRFSGGFQFFSQYNKNFGNWVLVPDARIITTGLFGLTQWKSGAFDITAGIRADANKLSTFTTPIQQPDTLNATISGPEQAVKKNYHPASFSAGVVYHLNADMQLKLSLASGYAAPNYAQLTAYGRHEGTYRFEVGNNNLNISKNLQGDISWSIRRPGFQASVSAYLNSIGQYIYIAPSGEYVKDLKVYRWKQDNAVLKGLELELNIHPASVSWLEYFLTAGIIRGQLKENKSPLPYIPANKLITGMTWHGSNQKWKELYATLQFNAYAAQKRPATFEAGTAGYLLTNVFIGGKPPMGKDHHWQWSVFATNLFNKAYFSHTSLVKNIGIYEPGRNIGLQCMYQF
ncbi:hypothetical protein BC349_17790 [Flavihumibacter stibioxidans]|uniref:TonB-dependent receptor n=2 Tax=Flavihumibacter stibioxidans TaxID=1834163 RepID=A0ABR7MD01_9BACT|nr:hypothetical protein [Flavihumibacter stibioxidans]